MYTEAEIERAARILCDAPEVQRYRQNYTPHRWLDAFVSRVNLHLKNSPSIEAALKQARAAGVKP